MTHCTHPPTVLDVQPAACGVLFFLSSAVHYTIPFYVQIFFPTLLSCGPTSPLPHPPPFSPTSAAPSPPVRRFLLIRHHRPIQLPSFLCNFIFLCYHHISLHSSLFQTQPPRPAPLSLLSCLPFVRRALPVAPSSCQFFCEPTRLKRSL